MTDKPMILVVDDDPINRLILSRILKGILYNYDECANGAEAVDWLTRTDQKHVVVLLDLNMPVMDGYEMLDFLKTNRNYFHHTQISIVVVSASEYAKFHERCPEAEIVTYIQKPVSRDIVIKAIGRADTNFLLK